MGSEVHDHSKKQTTARSEEMKCKQCGKFKDASCTRTDCGISEVEITAEARRVYRKERSLIEQATATQDFYANYAKVAGWSESLGYQRPQDRALLESWAASSNEGKIAVLAIARTL